MIDTDKYEGHSEGPWEQYSAGYHAVVLPLDDSEHGQEFTLAKLADAQLIADAPLILQALIDERAEVKRLREVLKLFEQGFRLEDWLGIYHKDVLREWCNYLGIPEVDE